MKKCDEKVSDELFQIFPKGKKGVSPVIATVLLVALMLVLAAIVFAWAKGFVKEQLQKNGESTDVICGNLKFDANFIERGTVEGKMSGTLQVVNRGTVPIYGFDIKQKVGGQSQRTPFLFSVSAGDTIPEKNVILAGAADDLEIYPIILATVQNQKVNKQYTCLHNAKKIQLN